MLTSTTVGNTVAEAQPEPPKVFPCYLTKMSGAIDLFNLYLSETQLCVCTVAKGNVKTTIDILMAHVKVLQRQDRDDSSGPDDSS